MMSTVGGYWDWQISNFEWTQLINLVADLVVADA